MRGIIKDGTYTKHEKERGKLRFVKPDGAWSINMAEVDKTQLITKEVSKIVFITEKKEYSISAETALEKGFFRQLGGEDKWIVPMRNWNIKTLSLT